MPLETATYLSDLVTSNPAHTDSLSQADSHMRLLKSTLQTTLPGANAALTRTILSTQVGHLASAGNLANPSYSFSSNAALGFYDAGSSVLGLAGSLLVGTNLTVTGTANFATVAGASAVYSGSVTAGSFVTAGAVTAASVAASGALSGASAAISGALGSGAFTGSSTGSFAGLLTPSGGIAAHTVTGLLTANAGITTTFGTYSGNVSMAGLTATTGTFSGAVSMAGLTATTGTFSGAVSMAGLTATTINGSTGTFSGAVSMAGLTATTISGSTGTFSGSVAANAGITTTTITASGAVSTGALTNTTQTASGLITANGGVSSTTVAASGAYSGGTGQLVPVGACLIWWTDVLPTGYIWANGVDASRAAQPNLFALWGTLHGAGNGTTTFGVPDLRDTVPVGKSTMGGAASRGLQTLGNTVLNALIGVANQALSLANLPPYTPSGSVSSVLSTGGLYGFTATGVNVGYGGAETGGGGQPISSYLSVASTFTGTAQGGSNTAVNNVQPSTTCNYIIKAG